MYRHSRRPRALPTEAERRTTPAREELSLKVLAAPEGATDGPLRHSAWQPKAGTSLPNPNSASVVRREVCRQTAIPSPYHTPPAQIVKPWGQSTETPVSERTLKPPRGDARVSYGPATASTPCTPLRTHDPRRHTWIRTCDLGVLHRAGSQPVRMCRTERAGIGEGNRKRRENRRAEWKAMQRSELRRALGSQAARAWPRLCAR